MGLNRGLLKCCVQMLRIFDIVRDIFTSVWKLQNQVLSLQCLFLWAQLFFLGHENWFGWLDEVSRVIVLAFNVSHWPTDHSAIVDKLNESKGNNPTVPKAVIPLRYVWFGKRWRTRTQRDGRSVRKWQTDRQTDESKDMLAQNVAWCVIRPHTLCISHLLLWTFGWSGALKGNCTRRWQQSFVTSVHTCDGGGSGAYLWVDASLCCSPAVETCGSSLEPFSCLDCRGQTTSRVAV